MRRVMMAALAVLGQTLALEPALAQADVTFHGTLIDAPPCVVNGGQKIQVDFGNDVMTTRIDGSEYKQRIDFTLDCSAATSSHQKVRITGTAAGFDAQALSGDIPGFGIALYHGQNRYTLGEWLSFTEPNLPEFYAVPVKDPQTDLSGGRFSVLASLVVDYQ